jgi:hypothetical protein
MLPNLDGENTIDARPSNAARPGDGRGPSPGGQKLAPSWEWRPREAHHHQRGAEAVDGGLSSAEDLIAQARLSP